MERHFDTEKCKFVVILSQIGRLIGGLLAKNKWSKNLIGYRASKRQLDSCLANTLDSMVERIERGYIDTNTETHPDKRDTPIPFSPLKRWTTLNYTH